ncbi:hydrogenase maturation nickel metallochaperone HypA [Methanocella sp. CWC-04]|uniref:Hydrogenase maturation factor HypA n=1 Tax=Methanooceanicella nereidis TaxID=2052831 RepID=A0AAP2RBD7_9EURY|nr:hydrogenase maturation nickel metallochaperone HypA [Methanocella sp. CWC-04]MCD1294451.1 hydrogenase maturation nickel metallochaperone HypA [Methanocella sp. CWC-04]
MHELSIATDLINAAIATAQQNNAKQVLSVTVEVGEMAMVNPEQLIFMYEVLTEENMLKGSKLNLVKVPAVAKCESCGYEGPVEDKYTCSCPKCSKTLKLIAGRDISLKNMEIEV